VVGYIGRLAPVKGIENAIDVTSRFAERNTYPVSMLVAGTGHRKYVDELRRRAAQRGLTVDFRGWMEIDDFCASVDVALMPSTWLEPFGRVPVEVGMRGVPVLVSPLGGLPEAVALSGAAYAFADFTDTVSAADELQRIVHLSQENGDQQSPRPRTASPSQRARPALARAALEAVEAALKTIAVTQSMPGRGGDR
jgi:glycosyltransferase involved in cell wall biosynthesis